MNHPLFTGACTALVTPFLDGKVNYPMLEQLIARQLDSGIHTLVIGGTTGESAALTDSEKLTMVRRAKEFTGDDCIIIAGTGSNSTEHALSLSCQAAEMGADALLVVSPYYNKATADGLYLHYSSIAANVNIPVILYNVPSRTGMDIPCDVCQQLSRIPNICGIKEASSDFHKTLALLSLCPNDFCIWSGNDDTAVPAISVGAKGVISVLSNIFPERVQAMAQAAIDGDFDTAAALQLSFQPLIRMLFSEVSPVPVKAAMKLIGYDCGKCRLPLTEASAELTQKLADVLGY